MQLPHQTSQRRQWRFKLRTGRTAGQHQRASWRGSVACRYHLRPLDRGGPTGTDIRQRLERTLRDRYTVKRELGGGGVARVFVADETELAPSVVAKGLTASVGWRASTGRSPSNGQRTVDVGTRPNPLHRMMI